MKELKSITNTGAETETLGGILAQALFPGAFIALYGGLGAGKTTFTRGVGEGLGILDISSPTFTILQEHRGKYPLYHIDAYRLRSGEELFDIGFEEYVQSEGVIMLEWPEHVLDVLPENRLEIQIGGSGAMPRVWLWRAIGPRYEEMLEMVSLAMMSPATESPAVPAIFRDIPVQGEPEAGRPVAMEDGGNRIC